MATKTIKTQIGLRRDTEANYELVKDTLIPVKGEVCMVDTDKGLKFKIGDGTSTFAQLDFIEPNTSGACGTNVEANPELTGNEEKLNSITIDGTNYDIPSGAEAYVEEHQTLVINNNGTGGASNNNLFQRRLDQPSAEWNSGDGDLKTWLENNMSNIYVGQYVFMNVGDGDYKLFGIIMWVDADGFEIIPATTTLHTTNGLIEAIYMDTPNETMEISLYNTGSDTADSYSSVYSFKLF